MTNRTSSTGAIGASGGSAPVIALLCFLAGTGSSEYAIGTESTRQPSSNDLTLREYVDVRFDAQEKAVSAALAAAKEAVTKAESASEKRFESINEFRGTLSDQARTLMPRAEAEAQFKVLNEKLEAINARLSARENQSQGLAAGWGYVVGFVGVATAIGMVLLQTLKRRPGA
jgi:hypothetical protein